MKFIFYVLMIPAAFFLGKVLYSPLFGEEESGSATSETVVEIKVRSPMGTITETIDYHDIDPKDYPEKVTLSDATVLTDKNGLSPLKLDPGSPAKPLLLTEMVLEVTSPLASHLTGEISVLDTDFAHGVAMKRMERRVAMADAASGGAKPPVATPSEPTPPKPEVAVAAPTPDSGMGGGMAGDTPVEPAEEPEPAPVPETPASLSNEQIIAAMKESLEGGKIKELDASKVINWEAIGDESFDGQDFQVGVATYKEMTILGEKTLQAKAMFKQGKLDKWIHSKTGMEIR
ncbi:MAG: hypothetical protein ACSHYB_04675 [Roseibacillus sp.]